MDNPAAANTLGTLGAVCWSIQLLPQIILNHRRGHATGLQPSMMILWAWAGVPLGVYNIVSAFNLALQVQPQILALLSLVTWGQCLHYQKRWTVLKTVLAAAAIGAVMAGVEVGLVFALWRRRRRWAVTLMAVLSALLLALGVLRHYVDIWKHRTVRGISFLFVGIDALGDVFSLVSVVFQAELDVLGVVIYGTELVLWLGVFVAGGWYNLLPRLRERWRRLVRGGKEGERGEELEQGQREDNNTGRATGMATLHDGASSTSVFRTASRSRSIET
ncbi:PQ loop repeat-domain-containing protein [Cercophora samala]|uniref:PQ loop repeat-domain-containing protein n=1 Tax=Cercophora samala TaxID=330535 RepID=A0AA39ZFL5_9PEZI|nr:PQ loop repeat-domain-containing protein [Cercophora samala]